VINECYSSTTDCDYDLGRNNNGNHETTATTAAPPPLTTVIVIVSGGRDGNIMVGRLRV